MDFLGLLLIGLVAGWLASLLVKGRGLGLFGDIVVGIVGALIGGLIFDALDITIFADNIALSRFTIALVGSIILLLLANALQPRARIESPDF